MHAYVSTRVESDIRPPSTMLHESDRFDWRLTVGNTFISEVDRAWIVSALSFHDHTRSRKARRALE